MTKWINRTLQAFWILTFAKEKNVCLENFDPYTLTIPGWKSKRVEKLMLDGRVEGVDLLGPVDDGLRADVCVAGDRTVEGCFLLAVSSIGHCVSLITCVVKMLFTFDGLLNLTLSPYWWGFWRIGYDSILLDWVVICSCTFAYSQRAFFTFRLKDY